MKKIIICDFSGIQNYLFDIKHNKSSTKRLKGRSLFIELLLEKILEYMMNRLGNCENYILSGGKFIFICNDFSFDIFDQCKSEIEQRLYKQSYGELKIIFGLADFDEVKDNFKICLTKAYENLEKNKNRVFEKVFVNEYGNWNDGIFVFSNDRGPKNVCKFSRDRLIDDTMTGILENEIGKDFFDDTNKGISYEAGLDLLITKGITKGKVNIDENKYIDLIKGYAPTKINLHEIKNRLDLLKGVPVKNDANKAIKSFEELALKDFEQGLDSPSGSFNKLAVLKGDIDDLGKIFQFGLKEENYKENYKGFSEMLDKFWTKKLYDFIDSHDSYGNELYVVYAGGDDFVILGRWDVIIQFYIDLLHEFNVYFKKQNIKDLGLDVDKIHFSGAINLFGSHDTFFTVVKQTEALLDDAKKGSKNQVNVFGHVLENDKFTELMSEAQEFYQRFVKTDIVSVSTLRFLLDTAKKIVLEQHNGKNKEGNKNDFLEYGLWESELFYHLARNYKSKYDDPHKGEFRKYIDGMLLKNITKVFNSLIGNNSLFDENRGEKLFVMMTYLLYHVRDQ